MVRQSADDKPSPDPLSQFISFQLMRTTYLCGATGISLKTQELFLVVFVCRYLDLFTTYYSLYNSVMKILYIASTGYIVYMIRYKDTFKASYDHSHDSFLHIKFGVVPMACLAVLTMLVHQSFDIIELLWTFSIYLEAIAIVPQLIVLQRHQQVENLDGHYIFLLGAYRGLYILNWIYRSYYEQYYHHNWIVYIAGAIQTLLYADFFYYYIISKYYGEKFTLPS
jgi:ER lumen protein retaining receptor